MKRQRDALRSPGVIKDTYACRPAAIIAIRHRAAQTLSVFVFLEWQRDDGEQTDRQPIVQKLGLDPVDAGPRATFDTYYFLLLTNNHVLFFIIIIYFLFMGWPFNLRAYINLSSAPNAPMRYYCSSARRQISSHAFFWPPPESEPGRDMSSLWLDFI